MAQYDKSLQCIDSVGLFSLPTWDYRSILTPPEEDKWLSVRELNPNCLALIAVHIDGPWGDVLVPKSIQTTTWNVFWLRQGIVPVVD
jgi:hypothetical protein